MRSSRMVAAMVGLCLLGGSVLGAEDGAPTGRGGKRGGEAALKHKGAKDPAARIDKLVAKVKDKVARAKERMLVRLATMETRMLEKARKHKQGRRPQGNVPEKRLGSKEPERGARTRDARPPGAQRFERMRSRLEGRVTRVKERIANRYERMKERIGSMEGDEAKRQQSLQRLETGHREIVAAVDGAHKEVLDKADQIRQRLLAVAGEG